MANMRKVGLFGLEPCNDIQCFRKAKVREVFFFTQRINNQHLQSFQFFQFSVGDIVGVGDIGEVVDTKAENGKVFVHRMDRNNLQLRIGN